MTNWNKIEEIAKEVRNNFNSEMSDFDVNSGDCTTFAKKMADKLTEEGIEFQIMVTEGFELMDEMEGYEVETTEFGHWTSHCYVVIENFGFDAFDVEGMEEREMTYLNEL